MNTSIASDRKKGRILVIASALLWGLAGVCVKSISWNPFSLMGARSLISLIMLLILNRSFKIKFTVRNLVGGLMMFLTGTLYMASIKLTTAGTAIVLQYVAPILVFLISVFFLKRKAKWMEILLSLVVFSGVILSFVDDLNTTALMGNLLGLASGFTYAVQIVVMNDEKCDADAATQIGNLMAVILCIPFMFFDEGLTFTASNILWVLILGVFQYGLGNICFARGVQKVDSVECALLLTFEPVFNPIPVAIFCHEIMGTKAIIGALVVLAGVTMFLLWPSLEQKWKRKKNEDFPGR